MVNGPAPETRALFSMRIGGSGHVTKKIVRPRKIILGQKVAMKFAPINVRPCQILSREGSHHDGGVQKAVARPSGCETSKWIASECAEKILWSRHVCT